MQGCLSLHAGIHGSVSAKDMTISSSSSQGPSAAEACRVWARRRTERLRAAAGLCGLR